MRLKGNLLPFVAVCSPQCVTYRFDDVGLSKYTCLFTILAKLPSALVGSRAVCLLLALVGPCAPLLNEARSAAESWVQLQPTTTPADLGKNATQQPWN